MTIDNPESEDLTRPLMVAGAQDQTKVEPSPSRSPVGLPDHLEHSEVLYVPLAVTVGDGFKFGCGFFLASGLTILALLVTLSALFVLSSLMGLTLPGA